MAALDFRQLPPAGPHYPLFDRVLACLVTAGQSIQALCLLLSLSHAVLDEHIIRLGLLTPHDRPMRGGGPKGWSLKDTLLMIILRLAGIHPEVIGQKLDMPRTASAVRAKARRLGIPCPKRKDVYKPDPATLRDLDVGTMLSSLMQAAGPGQSADEILKRLRESVLTGRNEPVARPVNEARQPRKRDQAPGQQQFRFFGIVSDRSDDGQATPPGPQTPATEAEVDFEKDLSWFGTLRGRTKAQSNQVAVWVGFMLVAGGLHYKEAAKRLGVGPGAFRTFKTRVGIPSDTDRRKTGSVFDLEAAQITVARSGYELRRCLKSGNWFWAKKSERGVRYSPQVRKGERIIGEIGNRFKIITRSMLELEKRSARMTPFANDRARRCA